MPEMRQPPFNCSIFDVRRAHGQRRIGSLGRGRVKQRRNLRLYSALLRLQLNTTSSSTL